jgi:DNA-binding Lrp family transcriptional regulator
MPGPSIIHGQETAAYERIRAFVVGQVAKAGDSPMRLDSYRSLAKRFGVTQTTVMKALKDLISDGFLTTKPGIGVFTNPVRLGYSERVKLIGCFTGDGQNVLFARNYWQFFPAFADAILKSSREYQLQPAFLAVPVARTKAEDIVSMGFDAVLWSLPTPPVFELLRDLRKKMSVLALGHRCPGVGGVHYGAAQVLSAARLMFAEGRRWLWRALRDFAPSSAPPSTGALS